MGNYAPFRGFSVKTFPFIRVAEDARLRRNISILPMIIEIQMGVISGPKGASLLTFISMAADVRDRFARSYARA